MHGYEIEYVFGQPFRHSHLYAQSQLDSEKRFSETIMKYWATFAAEGLVLSSFENLLINYNTSNH